MSVCTRASLREHLARAGYARVNAFVSSEEAAELLDSVSYLGIDTVWANEGSSVRFGRQSIPEYHPVRSLMAHRGLALVRELFESEFEPSKLHVWTSAYRGGEHIDRHRDRSGAIQMMVCLQNDATEGGATHFECLDGVERIEALRPGDAILFRAREIFHFTEPVKGEVPPKEPIRTVAVGRFYRPEEAK